MSGLDKSLPCTCGLAATLARFDRAVVQIELGQRVTTEGQQQQWTVVSIMRRENDDQCLDPPVPGEVVIRVLPAEPGAEAKT